MKRLMLAAVLAAIAGCSSGLDRPVKEVTATTGTDQIQHVTITTHSFYFDPNRIVVQRGIPVDLTVKNGAFFVPHAFDLVSKDAGVEVATKVGMFYGSKHVSFTPSIAGEFHFHCGVDGHSKKGMMGMLVVKD